MESYLHLPEKMDHNEFQLDEDLIDPFKDFLEKLQENKKMGQQEQKLEEEKMLS